ncbi:uncharacterized protein LOC113335537 [Papaver somniferum]|uniref:uncharacterized protein LOC113335537 n=1 Tax=Papaver somniferum TaxID=3469 RepID=UPI000E6F7A29|nr:uncharacterized protein LOC113335537 [Papaver somniferum]
MQKIYEPGHSFPWKMSDFESLIAFINSHDIFINCQGLVITTTFPRETTSSHRPNMNRIVRFWSHDVLNLGLYGLPVLPVPFREVRYMKIGGSALVENPKENELAASLAACTEERDREKAEKQALATKVSRLEATISNLKSKNYLFNQKNM